MCTLQVPSTPAYRLISPYQATEVAKRELEDCQWSSYFARASISSQSYAVDAVVRPAVIITIHETRARLSCTRAHILVLRLRLRYSFSRSDLERREAQFQKGLCTNLSGPMSFLRPILPLEGQSIDNMPRINNDTYAASCNPPRQAKRLRSEAHDVATKMPVLLPAPLITTEPKQTRSTFNTQNKTMAVPTPNTDVLAPKRRGRKPSTSSRAAREAQRKMNHSIIEKARRTKINDALATLRVLVPPQSHRSLETDEDDDDYEPADEGKGKKGEEKEFKLDVLVRTVTFVQELTERVKELEQRECMSCGGKKPELGSKRKRKEVEDDESSEQAASVQPESKFPSRVSSPLSTKMSAQEVAPVRLPSIASWLPHLSVDPSHVILNEVVPNQSSAVEANKEALQIQQQQQVFQLPSPPSSTYIPPLITRHLPTTLNLPSPSILTSKTGHGLANRPLRASEASASAKTSPVLSPSRTAEDESAASTLLHIGSSSYKSISRERSYSTGSSGRSTPGSLAVKPLTPSSVLGMES